MDILALKTFIEGARRNSFSAAAESLELSTTSVSNKIQKLEKSLSARLFDRTTRIVKLTEFGEEMLQKAEDVVSIAVDMQNRVAEQLDAPQGKLRITATAAFERLLGDWLIEFRRLHGNVEIELVTSNSHLDFQQHSLDFAFRQGPLPDSTLIARKLFASPFGLYAGPGLLRQISPLEHPDDLQAAPCLSILTDTSV